MSGPNIRLKLEYLIINICSEGLLVFNPGVTVIGRPRPQDDECSDDEGTRPEGEKVSLCWTSPKLFINLVDTCKNLNLLNLTGESGLYHALGIQ